MTWVCAQWFSHLCACVLAAGARTIVGFDLKVKKYNCKQTDSAVGQLYKKPYYSLRLTNISFLLPLEGDIRCCIIRLKEAGRPFRDVCVFGSSRLVEGKPEAIGQHLPCLQL